MYRIRLSLILLVLLMTSSARGQDGWDPESFRNGCGRLEPVSAQELAGALGAYAPVVETREGLRSGDLRRMPFGAMQPLLQQAATRGWGILEVFTRPGFADPGGCALFMDGETLREIHRRFDLHGVWQIVAKVAGGKGETLPMSYMIAGRGHLIVGYPHGATVSIDDGDAISGEYDYAPYFSARIVDTPEGSGLFDIRSLPFPTAEFEGFVGPYGVKIRSMRMAGRQILVNYVWGIERERRARIVPIALRDRLAATR